MDKVKEFTSLPLLTEIIKCVLGRVNPKKKSCNPIIEKLLSTPCIVTAIVNPVTVDSISLKPGEV